QRRVAFDVVRRAERRAEVAPRVVEAVDVRPHQADTVLAADLDDLLLSGDVSGFRKSRRDQYGAGDLLLAAFGDRPRDELRGNGEDRDVDVTRNVLHALERLEAHDLVGRRVDRVDLPFVAAVDQVLHHRVADLA